MLVMNKMVQFTAIDSGYVSGADVDEYRLCYTVMMKDTGTNDATSLLKFAVAFLLIAGIPEEEIHITLSQGKFWQFSASTINPLPEITMFDADLLVACYNYFVRGKYSETWNAKTKCSEVLSKAIVQQ